MQLIIRIYAMNLETTGQQKDERQIFFRIRKDKKKKETLQASLLFGGFMRAFSIGN